MPKPEEIAWIASQLEWGTHKQRVEEAYKLWKEAEKHCKEQEIKDGSPAVVSCPECGTRIE